MKNDTQPNNTTENATTKMARSPSILPNQSESVKKGAKKENPIAKQRKKEDAMDEDEDGPSQDTRYDGEREPSLPSTQPMDGSQQETQGEGYLDEEENEGSSSGRKRQRVNEEGDSLAKEESRPKPKVLHRDPADKYVTLF